MPPAAMSPASEEYVPVSPRSSSNLLPDDTKQIFAKEFSLNSKDKFYGNLSHMILIH